MSFLINLSLLLSGIVIGIFLNKWFSKLSIKIEKMKTTKDVNEQFNTILKNLLNKKTKFKTRVNNTVYIGTKLPDYGKVDVIYLLDSKDIVVFKNEKCIFTTELVERELVTKITNNIENIHGDKINDVIDILGMVFSREDFEKSFNINFKELREKSLKMINELKENKDLSDIEKIVKDNQSKFDIDEILDKINKVGIENLSEEEKRFLNNYNK
jgi:hypothetical protein